jgi:hypothetical protein
MLLKLIRGALAKPEAQGESPQATEPLFPDAAERSVVLVSFGPSRSNPFASMAEEMTRAYAERGLHCHLVDMLNTQWPNPPLENLFLENKVRYGVAWAGIGAEMELSADGKTVNAFAATDTPVFKMMGDHPAYFLDLNVSPHPTQVNVYGFAEHRDFYLRHLRTRAYGAIAPLTQIDPLDESVLDFAAKRGGKIVFLKNGNNPEALRQAWRARLPGSAADILLAMSEELQAALPGRRSDDTEGLVVRHFAGLGVDIAERTQFVAFYVAQMDDYLRRVKSDMITRSLLDFPIEVHGENWEHIDFSGARARLIPFGDYTRSKQLIAESLAVLDMAPNTHHQPHERFLRCASRHTLCLTNRIEVLEREYAPLGQPLFDFTPDSIRAVVSRVYDDPAAHVEAGRAIGSEFKRRHAPRALVDFYEMMADQIAIQQGPDPQIQRFLVWPPKRL